MKISIIVPVYNEEDLIKKCLKSLIDQDYPKSNYEIVLINDGSTDETEKNINEIIKSNKKVRIKLINQKNKGRIIAREVGAKEAKYSNLFFTDSRCFVHHDALKNIEKINYQPLLGNVLQNSKNIFDRFFFLFRKKLYHPYFGDDFPDVIIKRDNFDKIPKGTGVLFCNKELFLKNSLSNKNDKIISDDTRLLSNIIKHKDILKTAQVKVDYITRKSIKKNIFHLFNRGVKFSDYYLDIKKTKFWIFIFLPILAIALFFTMLIINTTLFLYFLLVLALIFIFIPMYISKNLKDFFIVLFISPIVVLIFSLGIIKGILIKIIK